MGPVRGKDRMRNVIRAIGMIMAIAVTSARAAEPQQEFFEISTQLMEATFRIMGPSSKQAGAVTGGTVFLMGKPVGNGKASYVMVTAAHVFDEIAGELATISFRYKDADGKYQQVDYPFKIRDGDKALYTKHPSVDVAALYVRMPTQFQTIKMLDIALLLKDEWMTQFEIHPGDELLCLGYPLFASGEHGYPILRSGKIASYPLVPQKEYKTWLFDFRVFPGNSGGPVYFVDRNRTYGKVTHVGETIQFVAGLVTQQVSAPLVGNRDLELGVIIPATYIRETLDMLPAPSPYE
jgi:hypothetical protein